MFYVFIMQTQMIYIQEFTPNAHCPCLMKARNFEYMLKYFNEFALDEL